MWSRSSLWAIVCCILVLAGCGKKEEPVVTETPPEMEPMVVSFEFSKKLDPFRPGDIPETPDELARITGVCDQFIQDHPDYFYAYDVKAQVLMESGQEDRALAFLKEAMDANPGSPDLEEIHFRMQRIVKNS